MDTAPRSAFLAGVVQPHERTAMMGFIYIARSSASSVGPIITGVLAGREKLWVSFIVAGSLMVVYDLGILAVFGGRKSQCQDGGSDDRKQDEESNDPVRSEETTEVINRVEKETKSEAAMDSKELVYTGEKEQPDERPSSSQEICGKQSKVIKD
jgi:hypothetical protein